MIKKIVIRDVASYDKTGVTLKDLQKVNFIYGGNGTGKTTISRFLDSQETRTAEKAGRGKTICKDGRFVIEIMNGMALEVNHLKILKGGRKIFGRNVMPSFKRCKIEWEGKPMEVLVYNQDFKTRNLTEEMPGVFTIGGETVKQMAKKKWRKGRKEEPEDVGLYSVEPAIDQINQVLDRMGYTGFRIKKSKDNPYAYRIVRKNGADAGETLSEGEVTLITFLYFMQQVNGGGTDEKDVKPKVVVIDDPISSLDSEVMFLVGEMVRGLIEKFRADTEQKGKVRQLIVLTHNTYFHRQVSERQRRMDTHYWRLTKPNGVTQAEAYGEENPVKTEYEKLWIEVRSLKMEGKCSVGIENAMRRIIETYFVVMGGMNKRKLIPENFSDDIVDMAIVRSLAKWADEGSHMGAEELFAGNRQDLNEKYLKVFELLFEKLGHKAHYKMMMREA